MKQPSASKCPKPTNVCSPTAWSETKLSSSVATKSKPPGVSSTASPAPGKACPPTPSIPTKPVPGDQLKPTNSSSAMAANGIILKQLSYADTNGAGCAACAICVCI